MKKQHAKPLRDRIKDLYKSDSISIQDYQSMIALLEKVESYGGGQGYKAS